MDLTAYSAFLPEVLPYVHDCPQVVAIAAIKSSAIEFCERTGYWQVDLDVIDTIESVGTYTPVMPSGTRIVDTVGIWCNGRMLIPRSIDELIRMYRCTDWRTLVGMPAYFCSDSTSDIRLVPAPNADVVGAISMRASIAPTRMSSGVETAIYERHAETIARGARARLLSMSGQPAYDPMQATAQRTAFLSGCNEARIKANKANTRASVSIAIPRFI